VTHSAACHEGVCTSRDASRAAATSAPTVSRSALAVAPGLAAAGFAPSRIPAGTSFSGAALAARGPLRFPSQVPVGSVGKDGADGPRYTSPVLEVVGRGGGQPLDPAVRADMEARLGSDFSAVQIHTGDKAARSAAAVSATAYTVGHDVVFGQGYFDPASPEGRHRLAHELVHVQQQRNGPVSGTDTGRGVAISDPGDSFEQEAEATATRVVTSPQLVSPGDLRDYHQGRPPIPLPGGQSVQRCAGVPCDCAANEETSVKPDNVDAPTVQAGRRAALARSHNALRNDQILPQPRTTIQPTAVQRQQDQTTPAPGAPPIPAPDLASADDCMADGGKLNNQVFLQADGTPEPQLNAVYNDRDRLVLGTHDLAPTTQDPTPNGPVRRVQTALIWAGYGALLGAAQADGKYGPATNAALKKLKCDHNLQPTYLDDVGPKTMHCLNKLAVQPTPPPQPTPPGPGPTPPGPGPTPSMPSPFVFVAGVNHGHKPTGKWAEVQQHPNSRFFEYLACKLNTPNDVTRIAVKNAMSDKPRAADHVDHYKTSGGANYNEDANLLDAVLNQKGFVQLLKGFLPSKIPAKGWWWAHLFMEQGDYAPRDSDLTYSWGAIDRLDMLVDYTHWHVYLWFKDRYEWHPVYPGIYDKLPGDEVRPTNCVHAAFVELKPGAGKFSSDAADYWMIGKTTVPLSSISKDGTSNG
jgi:hypothetical protein